MEIPAIIYTFEIDNFDLDDRSFFTKGPMPPPGIGAICLFVPSSAGNQMFLIDRIWIVESCEESDEPGWDHLVTVRTEPVPNPMAWYDINDHLLAEGLVPAVSASYAASTSSGYPDGAMRITHPATIEAIFRLLGLI